ncbi:bifunctional nitric oxide dioxygenase/dihydropteridine reductase 2 [Leptomonas pyrrhocoris]|uniref:nitric oxide dioxygenase n=1 Tax=Leptomonas pyrrhocoris TaxID=157538 RepID=A0A0N0DU33_LEPPY|nr:bifunctional nitric oxide dioxygenase/dihydropteridine reductase 2 [Leptomonas pyrrhocoris]KPA78298.1 bifunctional nitric oxide dioxygenase/dihydropteridine reductase 2 [Leptomonas pyrrhocoris]|eukprot:XP_015656737.1 bifunctional nitric oxide dioxygenase/dihydropteridine reductase 2 [Leptomonas pyrrhocoris]
MPLAEKTIQVVEATAPAVAAVGPQLAASFYKRMFTNNPELKDVFIMAHQRNLAQPTALFNSVVAYATHLRDLGALGPAVEKIAHKHAAFNIKPAQYQIVGYNLLKTIEAELNPGQDVLDEWGKAYEQLAQIFITREEQIYAEVESSPGGWRPTRAFRVADKHRESDAITRFKLVPADGKPIAAHEPGRYLSIFVRHPSMPYQEIRQYSIVSPPSHEYYEVAIKRHDQGQVSRYMTDIVNVGDELQLAPPYGDFFLDLPKDTTTPIALISGGVGLTPMLSMLRSLAVTKATNPLYWVHAAHSKRVRAFADEVKETKAATLPQLKIYNWLSEVTPADKQGVDYDFQGHIDISKIPDFCANPATQYYFVGPDGFMKNVEKQLQSQNVGDDRIHYECFGPFNPIK